MLFANRPFAFESNLRIEYFQLQRIFNLLKSVITNEAKAKMKHIPHYNPRTH